MPIVFFFFFSVNQTNHTITKISCESELLFSVLKGRWPKYCFQVAKDFVDWLKLLKKSMNINHVPRVPLKMAFTNVGFMITSSAFQPSKKRFAFSYLAEISSALTNHSYGLQLFVFLICGITMVWHTLLICLAKLLLFYKQDCYYWNNYFMHNGTSKMRKKIVQITTSKIFNRVWFISKDKLLMARLVLQISGNFRLVRHSFLLQSPPH